MAIDLSPRDFSAGVASYRAYNAGKLTAPEKKYERVPMHLSEY
jgi:hypothetical protein